MPLSGGQAFDFRDRHKTPMPSATGTTAHTGALSAVQNSQASAEAAGKGVISQLQEFIQCSKEYKGKQGHSILQWDFEEGKDQANSIEFRATVKFVLDGVPHHAVGHWMSSKSAAKRDVAERALRLFVGTWGAEVLQAENVQQPVQQQENFDATHVASGVDAAQLQRDTNLNSAQLRGHLNATQAGREESAEKDVQMLDAFLRSLPASGGVTPRWEVCWGPEQKRCQAIVEVQLHGVAHKFMGEAVGKDRCNAENIEAAARRSTACRTLWYLQCPGYADNYEPDLHCEALTAPEIPAAPKNWIPVAEESSAQVAGQNSWDGGRQMIPKQPQGEQPQQTPVQGRERSKAFKIVDPRSGREVTKREGRRAHARGLSS